MLETVNARCAQRIHAATFAKEIRSVGLLAGEMEARSEELSRELAVTTAAFGKRVMLINVRAIGEIGAQGATAADFVNAAMIANDGVLDVRIVRGSEAHRALNDAHLLRSLLDELAAVVDAVIIDLPPQDDTSPAIYAPIAAAALDAVLLVTMPCLTTGVMLKDTLSWATESGGTILAIVVNDRFNPTLAEEMVREAQRVSRMLPFFPRFVAGKAALFPALNRHH